MTNRRQFISTAALSLLAGPALAVPPKNPSALAPEGDPVSPPPPQPPPIPGRDTPLAGAFDELSSGASADYAAGVCPEGIGFIGPSQGVLDWNALFHHDPYRGELQVLGKVQQPYATARHIMFDEASRTWRTVDNDMWGNTSGHPYYSHTLDPVAGDLYYVLWAEDAFRRYTRATDRWDYTTADDSFDWQSSPPVSAAFHPNLFPGKSDPRGIVVWARAPVFAYSLQDESSVRVSANVRAGQDSVGACIYSPAFDAVFFQALGGSNEVFRVDPGDPPTYEQVANAPVASGGRGIFSIMAAHPVSGLPMIIERNLANGNRVWIYGESGNSWRLQTYSHPFGGLAAADAATPQFIVCSLPAYQGMAALHQNGNGANGYELGFHIWKPPV